MRKWISLLLAACWLAAVPALTEESVVAAPVDGPVVETEATLAPEAAGLTFASRETAAEVPDYADVSISESNFPDAAFRGYVARFDGNRDGSLSEAELNSVTSMDCCGMGIASLKGIEYFVKLQRLDCWQNRLTTLDVSNNRSLVYLACFENALTSLDVSMLPRLEQLWCSNNRMTFLNLGSNDYLWYLTCWDNLFTVIDVSHNRNIRNLVLYQYRHETPYGYAYYLYDRQEFRVDIDVKIITDGSAVPTPTVSPSPTPTRTPEPTPTRTPGPTPSPTPTQTAPPGDVEESGQCGDSVYWTLDTNGLLTISGSGDMWDENQRERYLYDQTLRDKVRRIVVEAGVSRVGAYCFADCVNARSVQLPDGLATIGIFAFRACGSLEELVVPNSVWYIENMAFMNCDGLITARLSGDIGIEAFLNCDSMTDAVIADGATRIRDGAFNSCLSLKTIEIPASVTEISGTVFYECDDLTIRGYPGTRAESYAEEYGIPFKSLGDIEPTSVRLNRSGTVRLKMTKKLTLKATLTPAGARSSLTWKSSKPKIASVKNGKVTPHKPGTTTISVTTDNGLKDTVRVRVVAVAPTKVRLTASRTTVKVGKTLRLKATLLPAGATSTLTWSSSAKSIATVSADGVVKGVRRGTAAITVKTANGKRARLKIRVK